MSARTTCRVNISVSFTFVRAWCVPRVLHFEQLVLSILQKKPAIRARPILNCENRKYRSRKTYIGRSKNLFSAQLC